MAIQPKIITPVKKVKNAQVSQNPASAFDKGATISQTDLQAYRESIEVLRLQGNTWGAIRRLAKIDGMVSATVHNMVQVAMSGYRVGARNLDGSFSPEGTVALINIIAQMNTVYDYSIGFSNRRSLDSVIETQLRECILTGGVGQELVLDKQRLPDRLVTLPLPRIEWVSDGKGGKFPKQLAYQGDDIELNFPTVHIEYSHQDPLQDYCNSMLEAALTSTFQFDEFVQDVRRSLRAHGHSRLTVVLDTQKVVDTMPTETRSDPKKHQQYLEDVRLSTEQVIGGLAPEDSLVYYDTAKAEIINSGLSVASDYVPIMKTINGMLSTSLKTPPSVLGLRLEGSQSLSNTESLIFLKTVKATQVPVATVMRRSLTLALRLYGMDMYCDFQFDPIDLRPELELEAFKTMKQNRILQQLSLGHLSDDEASWMLGTFPRAPNAPELSGTLFMHSNNVDNPSPNGDPMGRALQSDQPTSAGGEDNEERT